MQNYLKLSKYDQPFKNEPYNFEYKEYSNAIEIVVSYKDEIAVHENVIKTKDDLW